MLPRAAYKASRHGFHLQCRCRRRLKRFPG